jgi:hypothetical protein
MTASILFRVVVHLSLDTGGGSIYVNLLCVHMITRQEATWPPPVVNFMPLLEGS